MNPFIESIQKALTIGNGNAASPMLAHADVFRARAAIANTSDPKLMLARHMAALLAISGDRPLFIPSFNYDFTRTRIYTPAHDVSQVGVLTEHARAQWASWRCGPPVFNFSCNIPAEPSLPCAGDVDPFGANTVFGLLHRAGGKVVMYGAPFSSFTFMHYIERLTGGPAYRYDKLFIGLVQGKDGIELPVHLNYHCRPMGKTLEYDWVKLRSDAESQGIVHAFKAPGSEVLLIDIPLICQFWQDQLQRDPLYLLDQDSRAWVKPELNRLGRRFVVSDFEGVS
jgi:aminoglycoside N3'-acetyltransferase